MKSGVLALVFRNEEVPIEELWDMHRLAEGLRELSTGLPPKRRQMLCESVASCPWLRALPHAY